MTLEDLRDAWRKLNGNIQPLLLKMNARTNDRAVYLLCRWTAKRKPGVLQSDVVASLLTTSNIQFHTIDNGSELLALNTDFSTTKSSLRIMQPRMMASRSLLTYPFPMKSSLRNAPRATDICLCIHLMIVVEMFYWHRHYASDISSSSWSSTLASFSNTG